MRCSTRQFKLDCDLVPLCEEQIEISIVGLYRVKATLFFIPGIKPGNVVGNE